MLRRCAITCAVVGALALNGCTTIPNLIEATGGIPVYDIVLRTKCELSAAFEDDNGNWLADTYPKFAWLQNWTAQADLTLQVLDQATLSPGVSFMQPLHNAYPTAVGPSSVSTAGVLGTTISGVSQSFAVAGGVSLNGQAQRTETLSFAFSVKELREWRGDPTTKLLCEDSDGMDLRGRLGLREWFREAVWPVVSSQELLFAGYHPKQASGPSSPQGPTSKPQLQPASSKVAEKIGDCSDQEVNKLLDNLNSIQEMLNLAADTAKDLTKSPDTVASAQQTEKSALDKAKATLEANKRRFDAVLDPAVKKQEDEGVANIAFAKIFSKAIDSNLSKAKEELKDLQSSPDTTVFAKAAAAIKFAKAEIDTQRNNPKCSLARLTLNVANAQSLVNQAQGTVEAAKKNIASANENLKGMQAFVDAVSAFTSQPIDPPIASIGQSVQFTLAYGGNVTPTWTFVRFKGPTNPLFSTSGTRIHTLNITLGPVNPATNAPSDNVKQNQFYLQLNNLLTPLAP
jgi:hypothetical protein